MARPSNLFKRSQANLQARFQMRRWQSGVERHRRQHLVKFVGSGQVAMTDNGSRYPFKDTRNLNPTVGQRFRVENVGTRAVAVYAPAPGAEID